MRLRKKNPITFARKKTEGQAAIKQRPLLQGSHYH